MFHPVIEIKDLKYEENREWADWEVIVFSHVKIEVEERSDSFYFEIEIPINYWLLLLLWFHILETFGRYKTTLLAHYKWNFLELHKGDE